MLFIVRMVGASVFSVALCCLSILPAAAGERTVTWAGFDFTIEALPGGEPEVGTGDEWLSLSAAVAAVQEILGARPALAITPSGTDRFTARIELPFITRAEARAGSTRYYVYPRRGNPLVMRGEIRVARFGAGSLQAAVGQKRTFNYIELNTRLNLSPCRSTFSLTGELRPGRDTHPASARFECTVAGGVLHAELSEPTAFDARFSPRITTGGKLTFSRTVDVRGEFTGQYAENRQPPFAGQGMLVMRISF
ncbi:MAG: hypothetical protein GVY29_11410 [Spirochaetes bacterium]|jgi:hypothetical protein|nr:hypothetical protein [Spirochaetota bacterium]